MKPRSMLIEGLANARDLGGLTRADGSATPSGVFFRAEVLDRLSEDGWGRLRDLGVRTVVDLRRPDERSGEVPDGFDLIAVDLDGDEREFWEPIEADGRWGTPLCYLPHLESLPHRLRAVLDAIARARPGGVLFHCGAGWDRTGLVAAVLLRAAGVATEAAADDYLLSFENADAWSLLTGDRHTSPSGSR